MNDIEINYVMKIGFFVDSSKERLAPYHTRVNLGPYRRPLTNAEIQDILYTAKVRYLEIIRGRDGVLDKTSYPQSRLIKVGEEEKP